AVLIIKYFDCEVHHSEFLNIPDDKPGPRPASAFSIQSRAAIPEGHRVNRSRQFWCGQKGVLGLSFRGFTDGSQEGRGGVLHRIQRSEPQPYRWRKAY